MQAFWVRATLVGALASLLSGQARGAGEPPPARPDTAALEKRIANLEAQLSAVLKEIRELRRDLSPEPAVHVVPLRGMNVKQVAKALNKTFQFRPGFHVHAVPDAELLMIRGDKKTTEKVLKLLEAIQPGGKARTRAGRGLLLGGGLAPLLPWGIFGGFGHLDGPQFPRKK
jgi:hypothetical protein